LLLHQGTGDDVALDLARPLADLENLRVGVEAGDLRLARVAVADEKATAAAIRDGWFHTGDIGHVDEDGYLYVDDRQKDMIVSGGENIATPEVERVLYEHPAVLEAAVIGLPHPRWGEVPRAFVVFRPGAEAKEQELREFCRTRLAGFKVPARFEVIDELPRTPSGKVLKRNLRDIPVPAETTTEN
jgi:fatty-acyl-CoA synthase